jgi:hypothetical protein
MATEPVRDNEPEVRCCHHPRHAATASSVGAHHLGDRARLGHLRPPFARLVLADGGLQLAEALMAILILSVAAISYLAVDNTQDWRICSIAPVWRPTLRAIAAAPLCRPITERGRWMSFVGWRSQRPTCSTPDGTVKDHSEIFSAKGGNEQSSAATWQTS